MKYLAVILLSTLLLFSCSKEDDTVTTSGINLTGNGQPSLNDEFIQYKVNGTTYIVFPQLGNYDIIIPTYIDATAPHFIGATGTTYVNSNLLSTVSFLMVTQLDSLITDHEYINSFVRVGLYRESTGVSADIVDVESEDNVSIKFTELDFDKKIMSGEFSFSGTDSISNTIYHITDGIFNKIQLEI